MSAAPKHPYDNEYSESNVYGRSLALLRAHRVSGGHEAIHVDVGCGFGHIAECLAGDLNVRYVGIDGDRVGLDSLAARGFEVHQTRFGAEEPTLNTLRLIIGNRQVSSFSILDTLEHLPQGQELLRAVSQLAGEHGALVVVSVPNVAHQDVGIKLAFGRWDYTEAGILDHTHVRFFTSAVLENDLRSSGLHPMARNDVVHQESDQHFPADHPALAEGTLLSSLIRTMQVRAGGDAAVVQLIRLCTPGPKLNAAPLPEAREVIRPFLTVLTRTQGKRLHTLREMVVSLMGQSCSDFELLIVGHRLTVKSQAGVEQVIEETPEWFRRRTRLLLVEDGNRTRPLNAGFETANGHYIAILDDDDLPLGHWIETFQKLAEKHRGKLLRAVCVRQAVTNVSVLRRAATCATGSPEKLFASHFDLFDNLRSNQTPGLSIAVPRGAFHDLKMRFDESLTTTEDWDYILRVSSLLGVACSPEITSIYRWWETSDSSRTEHSPSEWDKNYFRILGKLDDQILLMPLGSATRIRKLLDERDAICRERDSLRATADRAANIVSEMEQIISERNFLLAHRNELQRETNRLQIREREILRSGWWRMGRPFRSLLASMPASVRWTLGAALQQIEWAFTFQLARRRRQRDQELGAQRNLLAASSLFDAEWYRSTYPDVRAAGVDPILHYLKRGVMEGRQPGPDFDGQWYLNEYPDVQIAGQNPLVHFLRHGITEGRLGFKPSETKSTPQPAASGNLALANEKKALSAAAG